MKIICKTLLLFFIISLMGCTEETINNYYTSIPADNLGRVNIYIEGDITNEEAAAKLKAEIGTQTENIYVRNTVQLTQINIQIGGDIRDVLIENNSLLSMLTLTGNKSFANVIDIEENKNLAEIKISKLVEVNNLTVKGSSDGVSTNIICNDLITVNNGLWLHIYGIANNNISFPHLKIIKSIPALPPYKINFYSEISGIYNEFNFPLLEEVGYISIYAIKNTITFPKLKTIKQFYAQYFVNFETLNLPILERCDAFDIRDDNNHDLNINMPKLKYCKIFAIERTKMGSLKINAFLQQFIGIEPFNEKKIYLSSQSPAAPPTGQGLIDKETLIKQGNKVETD